MVKKLGLKWLMTKNKFNNAKQKFMVDERGVSPVVATVLVILITVILAVMLSGELRQWIMDLINKFKNDTNGL